MEDSVSIIKTYIERAKAAQKIVNDYSQEQIDAVFAG